MHIIFVPFGEEKKYEALGWVYQEHCPRGDGFVAGDIWRWEGGGMPVYPDCDMKAVDEYRARRDNDAR